MVDVVDVDVVVDETEVVDDVEEELVDVVVSSTVGEVGAGGGACAGGLVAGGEVIAGAVVTSTVVGGAAVVGGSVVGTATVVLGPPPCPPAGPTVRMIATTTAITIATA